MQPEFSYIIKLDEIGNQESNYAIKANAKECQALAERLKIKEIKYFNVKASLIKHSSHLVKVKGSFEAEVVQTSVISLEDFSSLISESFSTSFSKRFESRQVVDIDLEEDDIEILEHNQIDIGELATEYLALALPNFPRQEGEVFSYSNKEQDIENKEKNPFAVLKNLK